MSRNRNDEFGLIQLLYDSIFSKELSDMVIEHLDAIICSLMNGRGIGDEIIKEIPILKSIVSLVKIGINIREGNLLRQTQEFLSEFNRYGIQSEKMEKYKRKLQEDPQMKMDELGRVLILLDRNVDLEKSKLLARFFGAYIDEDISWYDFCELNDILERLFLSDLEELRNAYINKGIYSISSITYRHDRLLAIGLLKDECRISGGFVAFDDDEEPNKLMKLSTIGDTFCRISFSPKYECSVIMEQ